MGSQARTIGRVGIVDQRKAILAALRDAARNGALLERIVADIVQTARHSADDVAVTVVLDRVLCRMESVLGLKWLGSTVTASDGKWETIDA